MQRRIAPLVVVLVGVLFIGLAFVNNLFAVGPAFEEMIDDFRPHLTDESIETYQTDIQGLSAVAEEFETSLAPALSEQLGTRTLRELNKRAAVLKRRDAERDGDAHEVEVCQVRG